LIEAVAWKAPGAPSSLSVSNSGSIPSTGSFAPSWTYVSTDLSGYSTYKTTSPNIISVMAEAKTELFMLSGFPSASAQAVASAADNFFFSTSPTP
jgi:hypothetical protein